MTATAAPPVDEQLVSTPRAVTTFLARRQNLRLVKKPRRPIRNLDNETVGETDGLTLEFAVYIDPVRKEQLIAGGMDEREAQAAARYGRFECPTEGTVEIFGGEVDAAELHAWLMRHRLHGDQLEGFWRLEPTVPAVSRDELAKLMEAAWDEGMLVAIIEQERAGWARPEILEVAEGALDRLRQVMAEAQAGAPEPTSEPKPAAAKRGASK